MIPRVPFKQQGDLEALAKELLARHHPTGELPIPIELLAEVAFDLEIIPIPGYQPGLGVDAGLSVDLTNITVDAWALTHRENRCRFSIAHELSHLVLHRDQIEALQPEGVSSWKKAVLSISPDDYTRMEIQANILAGYLLVPTERLIAEYRRAVERGTAHGINLEAMGEFGRKQAAGWMADTFKVSRETMLIRLNHELAREPG